MPYSNFWKSSAERRGQISKRGQKKSQRVLWLAVVPLQGFFAADYNGRVQQFAESMPLASGQRQVAVKSVHRPMLLRHVPEHSGVLSLPQKLSSLNYFSLGLYWDNGKENGNYCSILGNLKSEAITRRPLGVRSGMEARGGGLGFGMFSDHNPDP